MLKRPMKLVKSALFLLLISMLVVGCSSRTGSGDSDNTEERPVVESNEDAEVEISTHIYVTDPSVQDAYKSIVQEFMDENPEIAVDLQFPGSEYEDTMKVKMAANNLPDIFDTHGWAKLRYGDYLADLSGEDWVADIKESVKSTIVDEDGKVYAMPLSEDRAGITYNAGVLEEYGIEPPTTVDEFLAASEKIVQESDGETVPIGLAGVDDWTIGQFFDYFANSYLITPEENYVDELQDGSFDWSNWDQIAELLLEFQEKGYINKDVLTAKYHHLAELFAQNKVAFILQGPSFVGEAKKTNPEVKAGYMPVPAAYADDEPNFSGGVRNGLGVFKDGEHVEEAKKLVAHFAKPESQAVIADATKSPSGLTGVTATHEFAKFYEQYADTQVVPFFDRVHLPNGMWDVMCKEGTKLLAGDITPEQFSETMEQEVERLNSQTE